MKTGLFVLVFMIAGLRGLEAAPTCGRTVEAAGMSHAVSSLARHSAKAAWVREVRAKYGDAYSDWSMAQRRRVHCEQSGPVTERCIAVGKPCRR